MPRGWQIHLSVDLPESRNFVRHGQVHSREIQVSQKPQADLNSFAVCENARIAR